MSSENSTPILLFTDGSSRGNPGPGGYGVVLKYGKHEKELSEGFRNTTNNRMELLAVIKGLEALKKPGIPIIVYTDSKYVHDAVEKGWVFNWVKQNFKKKANPDLWRHFLKLYAVYKPRFQWVKGHAGHPENERCDQLATEAADAGPWLIDEGFELSNELN